MNKILIFLLLLSTAVNGQDCDFVTPRFQIESELNVFYGTDTNYLGGVDSLFLDIYRPINNDQAKPMAIWCFGGGFVGGNRESFTAVCEGMAERGYVAVTIDYRIGYVQPDFFPQPFAVDDKELVRAGFRAMQDLKGAIRFMKGRSTLDGVDIEKVFVGGASAGAITALAAAFIDKPEETDIEVVGAIASTATRNPIERPSLGSVEGKLHLGEYDATLMGVINIFGALLNITDLEPSDEEIIYSYHQTEDPVVPCGLDNAYHGFPFIPDNMPLGYGSCEIDKRLKELNRPENEFKTWIFNGDQHAMHDSDAIFDEVFPFLNEHLCGISVGTNDELFNSMSFYPNPVSDLLQWEKPFPKKAQVYNDLGQLIFVVPAQSTKLDMTAFSPGIYQIVMGRERKTVVKM